MTAGDIMTKEVITVGPATPVKELARILTQRRISGVLVENRGKVLGVVSEGDLIAKKGKKVKDIMSKKVIGVAEETPVEEIAALMTTHKIKRLPVFREKELVGIVSRADIVRAIAMGKHVALHTPLYDL